MANLNFGARAPEPQIRVRRGKSTLARPFTGASNRVLARKPATDDKTPLKLMAWNDVQRKLRELNSHIWFDPRLGDGRVIIGLDRPSAGAIAAYDKLSYYDRKEVDSLKEDKGPRIAIIAASQNALEPYTDILSAPPGKRQHRIITRSLASIVRACVAAGAFTMDAAERKFGLPFQGVRVTKRYLSCEPSAFNAPKAIEIATH